MGLGHRNKVKWGPKDEVPPGFSHYIIFYNIYYMS